MSLKLRPRAFWPCCEFRIDNYAAFVMMLVEMHAAGNNENEAMKTCQTNETREAENWGDCKMISQHVGQHSDLSLRSEQAIV